MNRVITRIRSGKISVKSYKWRELEKSCIVRHICYSRRKRVALFNNHRKIYEAKLASNKESFNKLIAKNIPPNMKNLNVAVIDGPSAMSTKTFYKHNIDPRLIHAFSFDRQDSTQRDYFDMCEELKRCKLDSVNIYNCNMHTAFNLVNNGSAFTKYETLSDRLADCSKNSKFSVIYFDETQTIPNLKQKKYWHINTHKRHKTLKATIKYISENCLVNGSIVAWTVSSYSFRRPELIYLQNTKDEICSYFANMFYQNGVIMEKVKLKGYRNK